MPILNYTTTVEANRSVQQIMGILVIHGARKIMMEYDGKSNITGLAFAIETPQGELPIRLPARVEAVGRILEQEYNTGRIRKGYTSPDQARRVAWRILKDWIEAQMAIVETEMVQMAEIFLPYMVDRSGKTLFEVMEHRQFALPPHAGEDTRSGGGVPVKAQRVRGPDYAEDAD